MVRFHLIVLGSFRAVVQRLLPYIFLMLIVVLVFSVRFVMLNKYVSPPGSDMGNHLTVLHAYLGNDVTGLDPQWRYPPLYFLLLLAPLVHIFPTFTALKVSAALTSSIIAIPFFFIVKRNTNSNVIALVTAGLLAFTEGYSEMICWGGIPNLFAIFFVLGSTYYTMRLTESDSLKTALLAGFFLGLVVGTHHLAAVYYIFVSATFIVWIKVFRRQSKSLAKQLIVFGISSLVFSLPYVSIYTNVYTQRADSIQFNPDGFLLLFASLPLTFFIFFREVLLMWVLIGVAGFAILWYKGYKSERVSHVFFSSMVLASIMLIFLIHEHPSRPLYFLYIPLLIAFSAIFSGVQNLMKRSTTRTRTKVFFLAATVSMAGFLIGTSYARLVISVDFYHKLKGDSLEALDWIKENTPPSTIVAINEKSWGWWVEGYSERKAFIAGDPVFFLYAEQREQVNIANRIFAGYHTLENNYLRVSDTFPQRMANPNIAINLGTRHQDFLFFQGLNSSDIKVDEELLADNSTMHINRVNDRISIGFREVWNHTSINRTVVLEASRPYVDVTYNVSRDEPFNGKLNMSARISPEISVVRSTSIDNTIALTLKDPPEAVFNVDVSVIQTNAQLEDARLVLSNLEHPTPTLMFSLNFTGRNLYIRMRVSTEPVVNSEIDDVQYFDTYDLIKQNRIDYILQRKDEHMSEVSHFLYDVESFVLVLENEELVLLRVERSA